MTEIALAVGLDVGQLELGRRGLVWGLELLHRPDRVLIRPRGELVRLGVAVVLGVVVGLGILVGLWREVAGLELGRACNRCRPGQVHVVRVIGLLVHGRSHRQRS